MEKELIKRRETRMVYFDDIPVGGEAPITVQSMTNTDTRQIEETIEQIHQLTEVGCELIRVAVPDQKSADCLPAIMKEINLPLIADIHFDYKLAITAINKGVDGLRINPGNIGREEKIKQVVQVAKEADIPIRVGVNAGSLSREIIQEFGQPSARAMVKSARQNIEVLERENFNKIVVSLKATNIWKMIRAHYLLAQEVDYPFHVGVTEAGGGFRGMINSAVGLGALLSRGYGDTLRISLTGDPVREVEVGWKILESLDLRHKGPKIISCPTCGRTGIDLVKLTNQVEELVAEIEQPLTIAVMGCVVNGPGEAREADIGIAAGKGEGIIFKKGEKIKKVKENNLLNELKSEINNFEGE